MWNKLKALVFSTGLAFTSTVPAQDNSRFVISIKGAVMCSELTAMQYIYQTHKHAGPDAGAEVFSAYNQAGVCGFYSGPAHFNKIVATGELPFPDGKGKVTIARMKILSLNKHYYVMFREMPTA